MTSLRTTLLLPTALCLLFWGAYTLFVGLDAPIAAGVPLAVLAVLLVVGALAVERYVLRPLQWLKLAVEGLPREGFAATPEASGPAELRALAAGIARLQTLSREADTRLATASAQQRSLEVSLRELEDRYALVVERANDGTWEWDIRSSVTLFSPRWKGMMGYLDAQVASIDAWKRLLHPDDRDAVATRLDNHLQALTPHFEAEYRLRHADDRYLWVHSRGTAIRHASGTPYRVLVMDNDIHARKELEEALIQGAEGLSSVSGMDFFQALMKNLSAILHTRDNLVCYCPDDPPTRARTLAYYSNGEFWENFEYDLAGTSCGAVIERKEIVYCPTGVCDVWPDEKQYDRDSYIGVPMFDSTGRIIGHFACMDGKPMRQDLPHLALFKIFSVRAAAELERTLLREKLGQS
ncbi:MAG: PAS domain-containing protein [Betaproteobacteria bacterium]|nr:PAS domain-containing protein [Betaproteobacteria bacterium]